MEVNMAGKAMGKKTLVAIALLVVGVVLLVLGFQEYGAFGSKLGRALGQAPSGKVLIFFIAGGICSALGLFGIVKK
jgi:hypothetical protein